MQVKHKIPYASFPYGTIATIPAGTPVIPATNLPEGGYWVEPWDGMTAEQASWQRTYGFHVTDDEVTDAEVA